MAFFASLALFPPYSLDTSILIAVLIGVVVLAMLTETLGWVFVGLVVPGYLASVFVIHPEAGVTIVAEAILTFYFSRLLSHAMSKTGAWSEFFGRERFFLIVLASVLVRLVSEAWLLPHVGHWLDARLGTSFTLDRTLYSIGLVLVPLTANAFWKLELRRGLVQTAVPVAVTYALLRFVLLPATNLSFSTLELTYEDVAQNFLASPKTYIILLTTAFLAARFNLLYGWDFNGVLVPALIALTWFTPGKLLATFAEVVVLVLAVRALLMLPGLRTLNLEGPRKTVLVFFVGFVLKFTIGWLAAGRIPGLKVTDLFGFGYLVPTLLAVKILQKKVMGRILLATAHTSLAGFLVGSLVGFGLGLVEPRPAAAVTAGVAPAPPRPLLLERALGVMAYGHATARTLETKDQPLPRRRGELRRYAQLWVAIDTWLERGSPETEAQVRQLAARLGLTLRRLEEAHPQPQFALLEEGPLETKVGWDTALLRPNAPGPVLLVPRPSSEAPSAEAAAALCDRTHCRAILVSGVDTQVNESRRGDALLEARTPLGSASEALAHRERLLVRADAAFAPGRARLHIASERIPDFARAMPEGTQISRARPEVAPHAWGDPRLHAAHAHPDDWFSLALGDVEVRAPSVRLTDLPSFLAGRSAPLPLGRKNDEPLAGELIVLERQVAGVLIGNDARSTTLPPAPLRLAWAARMASLLGLELTEVTEAERKERTWMLLDGTPWRGAGAGLLIRGPQASPLAIEVPTTLQEPGVLPFALELFQASDARALLFADPAAASSASHAASPRQVRTGFQAIHQALQGGLGSEGLALQIRGHALRPGLAEDVIVAGDGIADDEGLPQLRALLAPEGPLGWLSSRTRRHDGSPELARLLNASPQQTYSRTFEGARVATLWLSDHLRGSYLPASRSEEALALTGLASLPLPPGSALVDLGLPTLHPPRSPPSDRLEAALAELLASSARFVSQQDVEALVGLGRPRSDGIARRVEAFWSVSQAQPALLLEAREGDAVMRAVRFLQQHEGPEAPSALTAGDVAMAMRAEETIRRRGTVVVFGRDPHPGDSR